MIIGYAIIAVPTGIVTVEMSRATEEKQNCPKCGFRNIEGVNYCNDCGVNLMKKGSEKSAEGTSDKTEGPEE